MATTQKKRPTSKKEISSRPLHGMKLDENQDKYVDALLDESKRIVFCNAPTGSGKTTLAVAVGKMMVEDGFYDEILYLIQPVEEKSQGFLPGNLQEKSSVYFDGLYQALEVCGVNMFEGQYSIVTPSTNTFTRGQNFSKRFIIIDESQNFTVDKLRKAITRCKDDSKVVVIGHTGQIDLPNKNQSGFEKCLKHFASKEDDRVAICTLTENYRGWISKTADEPWE